MDIGAGDHAGESDGLLGTGDIYEQFVGEVGQAVGGEILRREAEVDFGVIVVLSGGAEDDVIVGFCGEVLVEENKIIADSQVPV